MRTRRGSLRMLAAAAALLAGCRAESTGPVPALQFTSLAAAARHTCGLKNDGSAWCWGYNRDGQLGDGTTADRALPVAVAGGHRFVALAAGEAHACGLDDAGAAWCWGRNAAGALGTDSASGCAVGAVCAEPVRAAPGVRFTALAAGAGFDTQFTCGLDADGRALCWGSDAFGELGVDSVPAAPCDTWRGPHTCSTEPVLVAAGQRFTAIGAGAGRACALADDGEALCWGGGSARIDTVTAGTPPLRSLSVADSYACGLDDAGAAWCWGTGWLGDPSLPPPDYGEGRTSAEPVRVVHPVAFERIAAGDARACGLTAAQEIWCWRADAAERAAPGYRFTAIAVGGATCGIVPHLGAFCWGQNLLGEVGDGTTVPREAPVPVAGQN